MTFDAVVVGAGVSGLATAYDLARYGHDVAVLERQVTVGGNAISERFDGFLMEHGPSTVNAFVPEAVDFVRELDLAETRLDLGADVRRRYLQSEGELHGISVHPLGFLASNYLSLPGRLSMMCELFRPRLDTAGNETIYAFAARRFGTEFAGKVMEPLAAGLFAGDARELSVSAVFPKLVEFEQRYGSVTRAVIAARHGKQPGKRLFSWPDGIASLPRRMAWSLGERIRLGTAVKGIRKRGGGFAIETAAGALHARTVVLAVQPHVAAALVEPVDSETAAAVSGISAPPLSVVFLGYKRSQIAHPLDGIGFLSTKDESHVLTGAQFCSTMFSGRAPKGFAAIAGYVGGARNPDAALLPERELVECVEAQLKALLGIGGSPVVCRTRHWPRGLPQYALGHEKRVDVIESAHERVPGLFLTGNYLHGVSVANCLATGRRVARRLDALLGALRETGSDEAARSDDHVGRRHTMERSGTTK